MRKLQCFIACAFGQPDVDEMYDLSILPLLKTMRINPLRVDKINHNKKIDQKIIELIEASDFGIADLSYARPSVYFEAGLLEGLGKGVIYLSRRDHFEPIESDDFGNLKIHFDLITKNIIDWTKPTKLFQKRLNSRINLITKPIIKNLNIEIVLAQEKKDFSKMSLFNKLEIIKITVNDYLLSIKFRKLKDRYIDKEYVRKKLYLQTYVIDSLYKSDLKFYRFRETIFSDPKDKIINLYISLKPIPNSRIESSLSDFSRKRDKDYENGQTRFIFLDSIDSIITLQRKLQSINF